MDRGKRCCGIDLGTYKITICCRGENGAIQWMDGRVQGRNWDYSSVYYQPGKEKIPCYIPPSIHQGDVLLTDTKRFFGRCDCPEVQEDVKKVRYPVSCKHGQIGFEVPGKDGMTISTTAEEVATDFLKRLREATKLMTREYINYAVISHPATWSILQKNRLTECAKEAGFTSISLIEEPTATAYDMLSFDADDGYYLIYDWGGGTFDLTLLEMEKGVATVKGTDGLRYVGGMDMDSLLVEYVKNQYTQLEGEDSWPTSLSTNWKVANDCREGKCSLATSAEVCIPVGEKEVVVTREAFNGLIKGLVDQTLEKCRSLLREKGVEVEDVEKVVLAGGVSKIPYVQERVKELFGEDGVLLGERLQRGLRAISLLSHPGFTSAFCNDVDPNLVFAQQLYALGTPGDILLGISTGGGAVNVRYAMMAAKLKKIKTILLTGSKHGACERYADIVIAVPETETYRIQELHLPVYHAICLAVEENMFGGVSL